VLRKCIAPPKPITGIATSQYRWGTASAGLIRQVTRTSLRLDDEDPSVDENESCVEQNGTSSKRTKVNENE
jgi:hypothetical protein